MIVFVDTSAFLAMLDANERNHAKASLAWKSLVQGDASLMCTSYVLLETTSLL